MFHAPNKYREKDHPLLKSDDSFGNNGFFIIPYQKQNSLEYRVQASDGMGWEHASVSIALPGRPALRCPTWEEMCFIKDLFWDQEDCVIQFHPSKSEYVNMHQFVLHLWRPTDQKIPIPQKIMVGK
jgi:hypothetical protein